MIPTWSRRAPILAALLLFGSFATPRSAPAQAGPDGGLPLWGVSHDRGTLYLLGSVHLLRPEVYPLDALIYQVFDEADLVVYELDHAELMAAAPAMLQFGMYGDGRTLDDVLPASLVDELVSRAGALGLPPQVIRPMKPWMAAMTLSALMAQQQGFQAEWGVEMHLYARGRDAGKATAGLETAEDQFRMFDGLSPAAQEDLLRQTLEDLDDAGSQLDRMTAYWQRGDAAGLAELLNESLGDQEEVRERLLLERNRNWIGAIEALFERPGTTMVVVGMGHLVGEGSVVELLRARGHEIHRLDASAAPY
jgi:uncharacterized protein